MKHLFTILWVVISLSLSSGRFHWTIDNDSATTNFVIDCSMGGSKYQWDLTKAAQFTAPLYAGDMRSFATSCVTYDTSGSYSCVIRALAGSTVQAQSNTVTFSQ